MLFFLSLVNHFIACLWYAVGSSASQAEPSWVEGLQRRDAGMFWAYVVSFHWSISQFTPAAVNYHPENLREQVFAVFVILFGFVIFSWILGSMTSNITQLRQHARERFHQANLVRRYFLENGVSLQLGSRINVFLRKHHYKRQRRALECDIEAFKVLPDSMLYELRYEVHKPTLSWHPLFSQLNSSSSCFLFDVCFSAVKVQVCKFGDELFYVGKMATHMLFVTGGHCDYYFMGDHSHGIVVHRQSWLSEAALWSSWVHRGQLLANRHCDLLLVEAEVIHRLYTNEVQQRVQCAAYAQGFVERMMIAQATSQVDDLWGCHHCAHKVQELARECFQTAESDCLDEEFSAGPLPTSQ